MANKLELTWVGKYDEEKIEPRILIEDKEKSNGDSESGNLLIHGDNLLALKSLEQKYSGRIKCIYIDPPYNTGAAFDDYDDNLEHSIWLTLMRQRLVLLQKLLSDDGAIFIQIDNGEYAYLKILCDEVFLRKNFISTITCKVKAPSGVASGSQMIFDNSEYILVYAKDKNKLTYKHINEDAEFVDENSKTAKFYNYILKSVNYNNLKLEAEFDGEKLYRVSEEDYKIVKMDDCSTKSYYDNYEKVFRTAALSGGREKLIKNYLDSIEDSNGLFVFEHIPSKGKNAGKKCMDLIYKKGGILFLKDFARKDEKEKAVIKEQHITSIFYNDWWQAIAAEGGVTLKNGKKPEILVKTILDMVTNEGDYVLDSFLGSGTTAAVAHKMNRKWIGIEMGDQCYNQCKTRLDNVIKGEKSGISTLVDWNGGGGYKFYELAPTLINEDAFGEPIINKEYNAEMLAAAVALHEGFKYIPSSEQFWKQSIGAENSYLYVTTKFINKNAIEKIHNDMKDNEYLVIACTSYDQEVERLFNNIRVKKIPELLLSKCKFNVDNYNFVINDEPNECEEDYDG